MIFIFDKVIFLLPEDKISSEKNLGMFEADILQGCQEAKPYENL